MAVIVEGLESTGQWIAEELGTPGRLRVAAFLAQVPTETETTYSLSAATGFERDEVERSLGYLVSIGWVREERTASSRYGRYRFNLQNERARVFAESQRQTGRE